MPTTPPSAQDAWTFSGVTSPNTTQVPDQYLDDLLPRLSGAELKVLLYITRRTFGFKKSSDNISLSQMLNGITTRDGRVLDHGVGLTKKTLLKAIKGLTDKQIILSQRRQSAERGFEPTCYTLNISGSTPAPQPPLGGKVLQGVGGETTPRAWGNNSPIQHTVKQETELSKYRKSKTREKQAGEREREDLGRDEPDDALEEPITGDVHLYLGYPNHPRSEGEPSPDDEANMPATEAIPDVHFATQRRQQGSGQPGTEPGSGPLGTTLARRAPKRIHSGEDRTAITAAIDRIRDELGDRAAQKSTRTRAWHLFIQSGLSRDRFIDLLYQARGVVKERRSQPGQSGVPRNQLAYCFAVVEDALGVWASDPMAA